MSQHIYNNYCKSSTLFAVNYQPLRIIINKSTTFTELKKVIKIAWRISPTNLRLFLSNGSEIYENDLLCIRQGTKIYASIDGQDLGLNILFLNYTIKDKISQQINRVTMLGMINQSKKEVVIKQIKIQNYTQDELTDIVRLTQLVKEQFSHLIVQIYEMITFENIQSIVLVTDYCEGGSLKKHIAQSLLKQSQLKVIVKQICESIAYYHSNNIIIKNMKLENFMFQEKDNIKSLKITDAGLNTIYNVFHLTSIENFNYFSPELLKQKQFSYSSDIWALGFPFDGRKKQNIQQNIQSFKYDISEDCPLTLRDLFQSIFTCEEQRLKIQEILEHPWLNQQIKQPHKLNLSTQFFKNSIKLIRGRTNSLRINSEENNLSLKKPLKLSQRQQSNEKDQCLITSNQFKLQQSKKSERRRCFSHMIMKRQIHTQTTRESQ